MKINFWIFFLCGLLVLSAWSLRQQWSNKTPKWEEGIPHLLNVSSEEMSALFAVNGSAIVYWRIYPKNAPAPTLNDFTNTDTSAVTAYGGSILSLGEYYTNNAKKLTPDTEYMLYALCVPRVGIFGGEIKSLPFKTTSETTP